MNHRYEKLDEETGGLKNLPLNDLDGKITGKIVLNVKEYFDENPEERIRLGWIKHISYTAQEIKEKVSYDKQSQYLVRTAKQIDEYTVEDEFHVMDKSEEMMLLEEMLEVINYSGGGLVFIDADNNAQLF